MNERIPLSFLLVQNKDEDPPVEPVVPFPAMYLEEPRICTAVLERICVLASASDEYERITAAHDKVYVDREMVEWRAKTGDYEGKAFRPGSGMAGHRQPSKSPWRTRPESAGASAREASDERARKNQEQVAATDKRELEVQLAASRAEAVKSDAFYASDIDKVAAPELREDKNRPASPPVLVLLTGQAERDHKRDPILKFCPGCKEQKPKSEFPTGKGYFKCDECRASGRRSDATSAYKESVHRNQELSAENKKHCPACDTDKPLEAFNRNSTKGDGLQAICRQCQSDRWTAGATAVRTQKSEKAADKIAAEVTPGSDSTTTSEVAKPEPATESPVKNQAAKPRRNGRPPLTFTELLNDLRQLSAYAVGLEQDNATLRTQNDQLRDEQAGLYDELHAIVGGIKKATKGGR